MTLRTYGLLAGVLTVVGLAACSNDPTSSGSGVPEAIVTNRSVSNQTKGAKFTLTAYAIDKNDQRMAGKLDAVSNGPAVALDSVVYAPELLQTNLFINVLNSTPAGTTITVSGHGLTTDITVKAP